ncbi:DUF2269 domain-containing protein [Saccharopolyspora phatthalungensis]|uniref:DUF2269 domain-containing protein n=1 Tax=Saccharopolyspora phatthalungensis TaxID=664693 RepID=A0A840QHN3_9PSEU|nr:DUF2269 domain-containing protein [Saccharopolyspora phatthalungensis]MBB5158065.1 hypothetical protein [Saccharopolyspora phatthalungensis]
MSNRPAATKRGTRRLSPGAYKLCSTIHLVVAGSWLGVTAGKLILGLAAVLTAAPPRAQSLYLAMDAIDIAFPPLAIATLVSGIALALGTKWGLLRHYWVVTKLVLTVAVIVTAVQLEDSYVRRAVPALEWRGDGTFFGAQPWSAGLLLALPVLHLGMLLVATVVSVYKPWGKTRRAGRALAGTSLSATAAEQTAHDVQSAKPDW